MIGTDKKFPIADASILCTALEGDHKKDPPTLYDVFTPSLFFFPPRNYTTDFAYLVTVSRSWENPSDDVGEEDFTPTYLILENAEIS